jgi:hypothetical protein
MPNGCAGRISAEKIAALPIAPRPDCREQKPPPQFGQTFSRVFSTQERQNMHSNEQIIASVEFGGRAELQFSQLGLNSSMTKL